LEKLQVAKLVNLKIKVIEEEIENALEHYSGNLYKTAFSIPQLRQKLIFYVLRKVPGYCMVIEGNQKLLIKHQFSYRSLELRLQLENHIHQGIYQIIQEHKDWGMPSLYQEDKSKDEPYQEFG
jgi:hypothetical protein